MLKATIAVLGGAMSPAKDEFPQGAAQAAEIGLKGLERAGTALDAVQAAVMCLEENPIFNCGVGARLNLSGQVELDAAIMDGRIMKAGAVGALQGFKNPVAVARKVMENTDHVLLVGQGAVNFARALGCEQKELITQARLDEWQEKRDKLEAGLPVPGVLQEWVKLKDWMADDTVGVLSLDQEGNLAAATSSGGGALKLPGRVGDVALVGCGLYAENGAGGAVLTGSGEVFIRYLVAKMAVDFMKAGLGAQQAAEETLKTVTSREPETLMALVTLDKKGEVGGARNAESAPQAWVQEGMDGPVTEFGYLAKKEGA
ncbi:MAG: isoaspartyl peptidase/L-asparaginase [Thermodesulfobacteriota bacterium]